MAGNNALAFTDPDELAERIEEYFDSLNMTRKMRTKGDDGKWVEWEEQYQRPPTMAGLALHLGVTRVTLLHYSKGAEPRDPRFIPIIARAKERIAQFAEEALYVREASNGAQFALRVNHGYGAEDREGGSGEGFEVRVIAPATGETRLAIPKWEPEGDDDE
jgi:hypothetical protein